MKLDSLLEKCFDNDGSGISLPLKPPNTNTKSTDQKESQQDKGHIKVYLSAINYNRAAAAADDARQAVNQIGLSPPLNQTADVADSAVSTVSGQRNLLLSLEKIVANLDVLVQIIDKTAKVRALN